MVKDSVTVWWRYGGDQNLRRGGGQERETASRAE